MSGFFNLVRKVKGQRDPKNVTKERINTNQGIIDEFHTHGGRVSGRFEGKALLLLYTIGAKRGMERINPVAYPRDDKNYVVIASKCGAATNPD